MTIIILSTSVQQLFIYPLHPHLNNQRQKRVGDVVNKATSKYTSNVHKPTMGGVADSDIKKTIKASKIQRDVVSMGSILLRRPNHRP